MAEKYHNVYEVMVYDSS